MCIIVKGTFYAQGAEMDLSSLSDPYVLLYMAPVLILVFYIVITFFGE